jgi:hypothetical protein
MARTTIRTEDITDSSIQSLKNRNLIINGAMQVAQRGTSFTSPSSGSYTLDRWRLGYSGEEVALDISQASDAPDGFASSYKITITTPESSLTALNQINVSTRLEGQDLQRLKKGTVSAESCTLSFWVKSAVTGTYSFEIYDGDNSRHYVTTYSVSSADTWEQKTIVVPGDTTGALDNNNAASFFLAWWVDAGPSYTTGTTTDAWQTYDSDGRAVATDKAAFMTTSGATFQITGVQLEVGDVATPFEHRSYGEELALCQRYYNSGYSWVTFKSTIPSSSATYFQTNTSWPTMRTAPTLTFTAPNSGNTGYIEEWGGTDHAISSTNYTASNLSYAVLTSAITTDRGCQAHLKMDAEL